MTPRPAPNGQGSNGRPDAFDVMTPADVAKWLQVEERQLQRFGVPAVKLGHKTVRYIRADVLKWLQDQRSVRGRA